MNRPASKNFYALFGLPADATQDQIDTAYQAMQQALADIIDPTRRSQRLALLEEAYAVLSSPVRRAVYDASLNSGQARLVDLAEPVARPEPLLPRQPRWFWPVLLLTLLALVGGYQAWRRYQAAEAYQLSFAAAAKRAEGLLDEARQQQAAREAAAERQAAARQSADADWQANHEAERRDREYADWDRKVSYERQRAESEAEWKERQRKQEIERQERQLEQRKERDSREAQERVERERQYLLNKLISEKRFDEARNIAKTSYELDRIQSLEKYGR